MLILDTDHITHLQYETAGSVLLRQRLLNCIDPVTTSVITLEEQCRGWIARLGRDSDVALHVGIYDRLAAMFGFFADWEVLPFSSAAADLFKQHRADKIRIGTTDLKIACIAITEDATLLTANSRDFERVPGLKFESWLEA